MKYVSKICLTTEYVSSLSGDISEVFFVHQILSIKYMFPILFGSLTLDQYKAMNLTITASQQDFRLKQCVCTAHKRCIRRLSGQFGSETAVSTQTYPDHAPKSESVSVECWTRHYYGK